MLRRRRRRRCPPPSPAPPSPTTTPCPAADGSSPRTVTFAQAPPSCIDETKTYTAVVTTNKGAFTIALDAAAAPLTVNNFVVLARYHYFDNTVCHRAIPQFAVQCGDPTGHRDGRPWLHVRRRAACRRVVQDRFDRHGQLRARHQRQPVLRRHRRQRRASLPPNYTLFGQVTDGLDTTVTALDALGNPDQAANGVPPLEQIVVQSVTITET